MSNEWPTKGDSFSRRKWTSDWSWSFCCSTTIFCFSYSSRKLSSMELLAFRRDIWSCILWNALQEESQSEIRSRRLWIAWRFSINSSRNNSDVSISYWLGKWRKETILALTHLPYSVPMFSICARTMGRLSQSLNTLRKLSSEDTSVVRLLPRNEVNSPTVSQHFSICLKVKVITPEHYIYASSSNCKRSSNPFRSWSSTPENRFVIFDISEIESRLHFIIVKVISFGLAI